MYIIWKNYKNLDKHIEDIFEYQLSNGYLDGFVTQRLVYSRQ